MRQVNGIGCSKMKKTQVEKSAERGIPDQVAGTSHGPEGCPVGCTVRYSGIDAVCDTQGRPTYYFMVSVYISIQVVIAMGSNALILSNNGDWAQYTTLKPSQSIIHTTRTAIVSLPDYCTAPRLENLKPRDTAVD
jgi:hypothetical protein